VPFYETPCILYTRNVMLFFNYIINFYFTAWLYSYIQET